MANNEITNEGIVVDVTEEEESNIIALNDEDSDEIVEVEEVPEDLRGAATIAMLGGLVLGSITLLVVKKVRPKIKEKWEESHNGTKLTKEQKKVAEETMKSLLEHGLSIEDAIEEFKFLEQNAINTQKINEAKSKT